MPVSPLRGILVGGEFRTFQSNLSEGLRSLPSQERAQILYHIAESQKHYEGELVRAAEPFEETRLSYEEKGLQELEMLTRGIKDELYDEFVQIATPLFSPDSLWPGRGCRGDSCYLLFFISKHARAARQTSRPAQPGVVREI